MIDDLGPDAMGMHYPSYDPATPPAIQPTTTPVKPPALSIKTTMLAHCGRDIAGQMFGRTFGLGLFNAAAYVASASVPCQIVAGGLGAVFGGMQAQRLAAAQIGSDTILQYCGVAACTLMGAAAVRGACNAAAVYVCHQNGWGVAKPDADILRPSVGPKRPEAIRMSKKIAIRFFLSACRNAVYDRLIHGGMNVVNASMVSQAIYGFFAQNRDLVYDLMKGEGWNKSVETQSTTTDTSSLGSVAIASDTKSSNLVDTSIEVSSASTSESSSIVSAPHSSEMTSEVSTE